MTTTCTATQRQSRAEFLRDEIALLLGAAGYDLAVGETTFSDLVNEVATELEAHVTRKFLD